MKHLTEDQFTEWASGERPNETAQHLRECSACLDEVRALSMALERFKTEVSDCAAARPVFSGAQIRAQAENQPAPARTLWKILPVPALVAIAVLAVMLSRPEEVKAPPPSTDAADDALLLAVNTDVYRASPEALRPAASLNKERNKLLTPAPASSSQKK